MKSRLHEAEENTLKITIENLEPKLKIREYSKVSCS